MNHKLPESAEREIPLGYHEEWVADPNWQEAQFMRICRMNGCGNRAVAALKRKHRSSPWGFRWWHYCGEHLYGRKIEDGVVKSCRLVPDLEATR